jgi:hypothetical protein
MIDNKLTDWDLAAFNVPAARWATDIDGGMTVPSAKLHRRT